MFVRLNRVLLLILPTPFVRVLFVILIRTLIITELTSLAVLSVVFRIDSMLSRLLVLSRSIAALLFRTFPFLVQRMLLPPRVVLLLLAMLSLIVSLPVRAFPAMWRETRPLLDLIGGATRKLKFYV